MNKSVVTAASGEPMVGHQRACGGVTHIEGLTTYPFHTGLLPGLRVLKIDKESGFSMGTTPTMLCRYLKRPSFCNRCERRTNRDTHCILGNTINTEVFDIQPPFIWTLFLFVTPVD